ncbi:MAG: DUF3450 domain-containing protein [Deltaproteobacteria bacterium]|nr:DUF3450 domain-containing protein [Deltaproteobacteria bacterium]
MSLSRSRRVPAPAFSLLILIPVLVLLVSWEGGPAWAAEPARPASPTPSPPSAGAAPSAAGVRAAAEAAVALRRQAQAARDRFAAERQELLARAVTQEAALARLTQERQKTRAYLADQQSKLAALEHQLAATQRLRQELAPLLDQTLAELQQLVEEDLPFQAAARRQALAETARVLNDYDADPARKTARLFTALQAEARPGSTVETWSGELDLADGPRRVRFLRLGRLELFALSLDGQEAWRQERGSREFRPLEDFHRQLAQAADLAAKLRVAALVEIPLSLAPREVPPAAPATPAPAGPAPADQPAPAAPTGGE